MLAGLLVALVGVMLVSALQRMLLYVNTFGLTELRLYTTAFMIWLGGVFAWFTLTVLRDGRPRFAFGALAQALVVLGGLHIANPDGLIARVNLGNESHVQVDNWGPIDADYISRVLSADAVPALLDRFSRLTPVQQKSVAHTLLERWGSETGRDWRSWNWSEWRAHALVAARAGELRALVTG